MARRIAHRTTAMLAASMMLVGCTTQTGRIGADDGRDGCRAQLVALDSTGNFFGEDILRGAAVGAVGGALVGGLATGRWQGALIGAAAGGLGGAAVGYFAAVQRQARDQAAVTAQIGNDLQRENAELDRTQVAFDQLMDCRLRSAAILRAAVTEGRIDRSVGRAQMADIRARFDNDLRLAQTINGRITTRGNEFDTAIDNVVPGGKEGVRTVYAARRQVVQAAPRRPVAVRFRPSTDSAEIGQISARDVVSVRPGPAGYAMVETASGVRGYAPAEAFQGTRAANLGPAPDVRASNGNDMRSLAATNLARRENFSESVGNAERLASSGGFELPG